ncbi:MAG: cytochrome b [Pseudomonadota bacterium]
MGKYSKIAILFHWVIAILIATNVLLATLADDLSRSASAVFMNPHKAIGISILVLSVARLLWRLGHRPPPLPGKVAGLQAFAGHAVHILFYVLMIAVPLTGWLMVAASDRAPPIDFFGLFTIDSPIGKSELLSEIGHEGHELLVTPLIILIGLHVAGALKHQFIDRLPFLQRMWP